jgi:hypothetical protein
MFAPLMLMELIAVETHVLLTIQIADNHEKK